MHTYMTGAVLFRLSRRVPVPRAPGARERARAILWYIRLCCVVLHYAISCYIMLYMILYSCLSLHDII